MYRIITPSWRYCFQRFATYAFIRFVSLNFNRFNLSWLTNEVHTLGRVLRLRHFRGNIELPNIDYEGNYDFDYQQNRHLPTEVKILPGDQLTYGSPFFFSIFNLLITEKTFQFLVLI